MRKSLYFNLMFSLNLRGFISFLQMFRVRDIWMCADTGCTVLLECIHGARMFDAWKSFNHI